jgi:hypothetical protein
MIDKLDFYHGAAVVRIVDNPECKGICRNEFGYVVNGDRLAMMKYTTRAHSPWRFTVTTDDIKRFDEAASKFSTCVLALICDGDGVCTISWKSGRQLLDGQPGWLAAKRVFGGWYAVSGPKGTLSRKVALNRWPMILFDNNAQSGGSDE